MDRLPSDEEFHRAINDHAGAINKLPSDQEFQEAVNDQIVVPPEKEKPVEEQVGPAVSQPVSDVRGGTHYNLIGEILRADEDSAFNQFARKMEKHGLRVTKPDRAKEKIKAKEPVPEIPSTAISQPANDVRGWTHYNLIGDILRADEDSAFNQFARKMEKHGLRVTKPHRPEEKMEAQEPVLKIPSTSKSTAAPLSKEEIPPEEAPLLGTVETIWTPTPWEEEALSRYVNYGPSDQRKPVRGIDFSAKYGTPNQKKQEQDAAVSEKVHYGSPDQKKRDEDAALSRKVHYGTPDQKKWEEDAALSRKVHYGTPAKKRLPAFEEICRTPK